MKGRRRPDLPESRLPDDIQPGDYWKVLDENGKPLRVSHPGKLTEECWVVAAPMPGSSRGYGLGNLAHHTVREHEDGTISVRPGDGSSNSILVTGAHGRQFHGYIEHGVWSPA